METQTKKNRCNHFTELGEELIFVDEIEVNIKCCNCGEVLIYRR